MAEKLYGTDDLRNSIVKNTNGVHDTNDYLMKAIRQGEKVYNGIDNVVWVLQKSFPVLDQLATQNRSSNLYKSPGILPGSSAIQKAPFTLDLPQSTGGKLKVEIAKNVTSTLVASGVEKAVTAGTAEFLGPAAPVAGKITGAITGTLASEAVGAIMTNPEDEKKIEEAKKTYFKDSVVAKSNDVEAQNESFVQRGVELAANDQYHKAGDDKSNTFLDLTNRIQAREDNFAKVSGDAYMDEASKGMENYLSFLENHEDELADIAAVKGKNKGEAVSAMYDAKVHSLVATLTDKNFIEARNSGDSYTMEAVALAHEGFVTDIYNQSSAGVATRERVQRTFNGIAALGSTSLESDIEYFSGFVSDIKGGEKNFSENFVPGDAFNQQLVFKGIKMQNEAVGGDPLDAVAVMNDLLSMQGSFGTTDEYRKKVEKYGNYWIDNTYPEYVQAKEKKEITPYVRGSYKAGEVESQQAAPKTENNFTFPGIQLTIREEADIDKVAQAIVNKFVTANAVTSPVN